MGLKMCCPRPKDETDTRPLAKKAVIPLGDPHQVFKIECDDFGPPTSLSYSQRYLMGFQIFKNTTNADF